MNEKLFELAKKANIDMDLIGEEEGRIWYITEKTLTKYSELLIKECASQVSRQSEAFSILNHFRISDD